MLREVVVVVVDCDDRTTSPNDREITDVRTVGTKAYEAAANMVTEARATRGSFILF